MPGTDISAIQHAYAIHTLWVAVVILTGVVILIVVFTRPLAQTLRRWGKAVATLGFVALFGGIVAAQFFTQHTQTQIREAVGDHYGVRIESTYESAISDAPARFQVTLEDGATALVDIVVIDDRAVMYGASAATDEFPRADR